MGRNKDELIKLAEKITGQECKDVLTKKDALKKIACHYLGEEKEFASIADCLESIVEHGASGGGSGGGSGSSFCQFQASYVGRGYSTAIAFSYDNVTSIQIKSLETPDGYEELPNPGEHLYMTGENVTSVKLVLNDGTTINGVNLTKE